MMMFRLWQNALLEKVGSAQLLPSAWGDACPAGVSPRAVDPRERLLLTARGPLQRSQDSLMAGPLGSVALRRDVFSQVW